MNEIAHLIPNKSDAEKASDLKLRIVEALKPTLAILDEARIDGLAINYQIGIDAMGKNFIMQLSVTRTF